VIWVYFGSARAQVELKSGRVLAPAADLRLLHLDGAASCVHRHLVREQCAHGHVAAQGVAALVEFESKIRKLSITLQLQVLCSRHV